MTAPQRLALCIVVVVVVAAAAVGWLQWSAGPTREDGATQVSAPEVDQARVQQLRRRIQAEIERLKSARAEQERVGKELDAVEASLEDARERVEALESEVDSEQP